MAHPQGSSLGMAIFSTRAGKYRQRQRIPGMSVVIRSDANEDRDTMAARLQAQFPAICKTITAFGHNVQDYFDDYDQQLQGEHFLRAVLLHIAQSNAIRASQVQDLASRWLANNKEAFELLGPEHRVEHVFTTEDIEEYEMGLLEETLTYIQLAAHGQYAAAPEEEKRSRGRHQRMLLEHREHAFSQAPTFSTFPPQPSAFPNSRVTSNPENFQAGQRQGPIRQIPPSVGQYSTQQARYPQQRFTPSTEVLEHIHPGSTNRGNFHSDPTLDTFSPPNMDYSIAIPSRGLPGPFTYASLPRVSLSERQRNYNSCALPRGKKNPAKKSSDDARNAGYGGGSRRQSLSRGSPANFGVPHIVESPQRIEPLHADQLPNLQAEPAFLGGDLVNHPNRYVSNPFLGQPEGTQAPRHIENRASQWMAREYLRGTRIWIGNIPKEFNRVMIEELLRPCRGLQGITEPRASSQKKAVHTFVYAYFGAQDEAEEALNRLPQTHFKCLGEGNFLKTSWPMKHDSPRPQNPKTYNSEVELATPHISPTTACQGKGSQESVTGEAIEGAQHSQKESGNLGTVSETKSRKELITNTNAMDSIDPPQLDMIQPPSMRVPKSDSLTTAGLSAPTDASPISAALLTEDRKSAAAHNKIASQADRIAKSASSQFSSHDRGPSTVDGTNDSTPVTKSTSYMEQKSYGPDPRQRDGDQKVPKTATNKSEKSGQKCKSSNRPQNITETPHSTAVSLLENTKPMATIGAKTTSVAKDFLGQAAHSGSEDDAAKAPNADVEATKLVATPHSLVPTSIIPEAQLLMDSSSLETVPKKPTHLIRPEPRKQASAPITKSSIQANSPNSGTEVGIPLEPSSNGTPTPGKQQAARTMSGSRPAEPVYDSSGPSILNLPLKKEQELAAQFMSRDGSNSTNIEDDGEFLYHSSTAPTSYLQTERSNSLADGSRTSMSHPNEPIPNTQTRSAGVDPELLRSKLRTDIKSDIGAEHVTEPSENTVDGENLRASAPDLPDCSEKSLHIIISSQQQNSAENISIDKDTEEFGDPFLDKALRSPRAVTSLHNLPSNIDRAESLGREREQAPMIPARSSSLPRSTPLPLEPAPVLTRQKKKKPKKPKKSAPAGEKDGSSGSRDMANMVEKQPVGAGLTSSEQTTPPSLIVNVKPQQSQTSIPKGEEWKVAPSLTIAPGLRTPSPSESSNIPKPETPFRLDGGADVPVAKGHHRRHSQESNPFTRFDIAAQSNGSRQHGEFGTPQKEMIAAISSQELRKAMEEAGYLTSLAPSSARHFAVKDPILAQLRDFFEQEDPSREGEAKDDKIQFSEKGKTFVMSQAEMQKQIDTRAFLEKAAAGKRLVECLPPRTPTTDTKGKGKTVEESSPVKSLYDQIEKIALHNVLVKAKRGERNVGDSLEDRMVKEGRTLLNTSPKTGSSKKSSTEWITKAEQYVKGSNSPDLTPPATPTRKSKTSDVHHSSTSLMMSLQTQGKLPEGSRPVIATKPGFKTAVIKLKPGEDASQIAADHLANPEALFGTDKIKLSSLEEIHAAFAKPGGAMTPSPQTLSRRTPSEERQARVLAQSEPLGKDPVGYWNQNSGFRDSDMQDATWEGNEGNVVRRPIEDSLGAIQPYDSFRGLSGAQDTYDSGKLKKDEIPPMRTNWDQREEAPGQTSDKLDILTAVAAEAHAIDQQVDDVPSSPGTVTGEYSDAEARNVKSVLGSENGDTTASRQDDPEYPVLPRGRSDHLKEDEPRAPSKGGYAAAARKSIDEKRENEEKEGKKQGNADTKEDPWAPEDVWGPGKSDGKGTSINRGGMSKRGFH